MRIRILPGSSTPIYRQIADAVRRLLASGELTVGDSLPSVRALAKELVINPNTVAKAYADLVRDGVLESQPGRGVFVSKKRSVYTKAERLRRLDEALSAMLSEALALDFTADEIVERMRSNLEKLTVQRT